MNMNTYQTNYEFWLDTLPKRFEAEMASMTRTLTLTQYHLDQEPQIINDDDDSAVPQEVFEAMIDEKSLRIVSNINNGEVVTFAIEPSDATTIKFMLSRIRREKNMWSRRLSGTVTRNEKECIMDRITVLTRREAAYTHTQCPHCGTTMTQDTWMYPDNSSLPVETCTACYYTIQAALAA